ncbi:MAG: hypothetical protein ACRDP3_08275 [Streptomyces sp.]
MDPRSYRMVVSTKQDYVTSCATAERQLYAWLEGDSGLGRLPIGGQLRPH